MFVELLFALFIIIVVLFFILFFKTWHVHIILKNNNFDYQFIVTIKFLNIKVLIETLDNNYVLRFKLIFFSKMFSLFNYTIKGNKNNKENKDNNKSEDEKLYLSLKKYYSLLIESKKDLYSIIELLITMIKFDVADVIVNLGVKNNYLTIKFCSFLWALTAPLYPLNFRFFLTPEINKLILKSDINIKFDIFLFNLLKIFFRIIKSTNLRKLIRFLLG